MRARVRRICLALAVVALIGAAALWLLTRTAPWWYAPPDPSDAKVAAVADDVEYHIVEQTQKIRKDKEQSWSLRLTEAQINAWLSARLPRWIEHRLHDEWVHELGTPQVHVESEGVTIAMPLRPGRAARVLVARLRPSIHEGRLHIEVDEVAMGRISLPGEPLTILADRLNEIAPQAAGDPQAQHALDVLAGRDTIDAAITLDDGRRVRLIDITLADGAIQLTAQTLAGDS